MKDIYEIDPSNPNCLKAMILSLVIKCPCGSNPNECPLYMIRKMPLKKRWEWVYYNDYSDQLDIYKKHKQCFSKKEF